VKTSFNNKILLFHEIFAQSIVAIHHPRKYKNGKHHHNNRVSDHPPQIRKNRRIIIRKCNSSRLIGVKEKEHIRNCFECSADRIKVKPSVGKPCGQVYQQCFRKHRPLLFVKQTTAKLLITKQVMKGTSRIHQTSPGKSAIFPSIHLLHLLGTTFGRKDFVLFCKLIQWYPALYEVRVPQAGSLPTASFRFRVTANTLTLG